MKNSRRVIFAVLLSATIFGGLLIAVFKGSDEPVYHDRPLSYWISKADIISDDYHATNEPVIAIRTIGTNALPHLIRRLSVKHSSFHKLLTELWSKQSIIPSKRKSDWEIRSEAAVGIILLGNQAKSALPELTRLAQDPDMTMDVAPVLSRLGADGYCALTNCFTNTNAKVRFWCVANLRNFYTNSETVSNYQREARVAVPALLGRIHDPSTNVAASAVRALGEIGAEPERVVPEIQLLLDNTNTPPNVGKSAVSSLKRFQSTKQQ